jgi:hypothetical protein
MCCRNAAVRERAEELKVEAAKEYNDVLALHGRVVAVEDYIDRKTPILHKCLVHGETHLAMPMDTKKGQGLYCCRVASIKITSTRKLNKAAATYKDKIKAHGRVELVGEYKGRFVKTAHRCLTHNEVHLTTPGAILNGQGLSCCHAASVVSQAAKKKAAAAKRYRELLPQLGRVELVGEYIDSRTPVLHRCLVHGELHMASPNNLQKGGGLSCCRGSGDSFELFCSDAERRESNCQLYIARVNGRYLKPGIAKDPEVRAKRDRLKFYKGFDFVSPVLTRAEAWAIEQSLHLLSYDAKPDALEPEYDDFEGRTELRLKAIYPAAWYIAKYHELVEELAELGWEELYLKHQRN